MCFWRSASFGLRCASESLEKELSVCDESPSSLVSLLFRRVRRHSSRRTMCRRGRCGGDGAAARSPRPYARARSSSFVWSACGAFECLFERIFFGKNAGAASSAGSSWSRVLAPSARAAASGVLCVGARARERERERERLARSSVCKLAPLHSRTREVSCFHASALRSCSRLRARCGRFRRSSQGAAAALQNSVCASRGGEVARAVS